MIPENLTIINYHKIETNSDIGLTSRHPDDFSNDLDVIRQNGYSTITFNELNNPALLPQKPIIISFDDAYESFYNKAFQILITQKMKAVVFVPVAYIGKKNNWDVQFFKKEYWHMNEQQIVEIAKQGIEIGSHAMSHRFLNHMHNENIKYELRKSKEVLENIISKKVLSVSYPFGRVNSKVLRYAKEYYNFGVQLIHSNPANGQYKDLCLNRINIYRKDSSETVQKKLEFRKHPIIKIKSQLIQTGAWATVIMQNMRTSRGELC